MQSTTAIATAFVALLALTGCTQAETETVSEIPHTTAPVTATTAPPTTDAISLADAVTTCIDQAANMHLLYVEESDYVGDWGGPMTLESDPVNVYIGNRDGEYYFEMANTSQPDNNVWCRTENGNVAVIPSPGISTYESEFDY